MGLLDNLRNRIIYEPLLDAMKKQNQEQDIAKYAGTMDPVLAAKGGVLRYTMSPNNQLQGKNKPGTGISFDMLRRFSIDYNVARGAINARKRQITSLDWEIVPTEKEDKTDYTKVKRELTNQIKSIGGYRVRFREVLDMMVDDLLTLDAIALYKQKTRGGDFLNLMVLDAATIRLMVDEHGATPMPPEPAYVQIIRGQKVAEMNADEMIYEMMNARSYTPYGLAPLESLILTVSSALKGDMYNLNYLTDGNVPEGLFMVEEWTPNQIKEFQTLFDAALAGDARATSKIKFMPKGQYVPTKKRDDMAFKEFQMWLLQITCLVFDLQPQELGFTIHVNKANGKEQNDIATRRGILPLANLLQEIFEEIIQIDLGHPELTFKFNGIEDRDAMQEAEAAATRLNSGQTTVDEERKAVGKDPLGIDRPFVIGNPTFLDKALEAPTPTDATDGAAAATEAATPLDVAANTPETDNPTAPTAKAEEKHVELVTELRKFRTYAVKRSKDGKKLRKFESNVLPESVTYEINRRLALAKGVDEVRDIIGEYMKDYQIEFLAKVTDLRRDIAEVV